MLVLSREVSQRIRIRCTPNLNTDGSILIDVWVSVETVGRNKVRLGFAAPWDVEIMREELLPERERVEHPKKIPPTQG